jgi:hypothetical protein
MDCDFSIAQGIYLVQPPHELDLHNNFNFVGLNYSVEHRTILLHWRRSNGEWVVGGTPATVTIEFREVTVFRFHPRNPAKAFTEDDCVNSFGYWVNEDWPEGVIIAEPSQPPDPRWLTAIEFMSGAIIAVRAASARARIEF